MSDYLDKTFSVINTNLQLIKVGKEINIKKIIQLNVNLNCTLEIVKDWIDCYNKLLCNCGINMPVIKDSTDERVSLPNARPNR